MDKLRLLLNDWSDLKMHEYISQIYDILFENNIFDVKVIKVDNPITLTYNVLDNEIKINIENVESYTNNNYDFFLNTDEEIIIAMTYHEIGHYLDFKQNSKLISEAQTLKFDGTIKEWQDFQLEREKMAWKLGGEIIPSEFEDIFNKLNEINIENYTKMYNR